MRLANTIERLLKSSFGGRQAPEESRYHTFSELLLKRLQRQPNFGRVRSKVAVNLSL